MTEFIMEFEDGTRPAEAQRTATVDGHTLRSLLDRLVDGGRIVFEGPPAELLRASGSFTGEHLARHAGAAR